MLVNSSLVKEDVTRPGIKVVKIPANDIAAGLGSARSVNMVMLGAYIGYTGAVGLGSVRKAMSESMGESGKGMTRVNLKALETGRSMVEK